MLGDLCVLVPFMTDSKQSERHQIIFEFEIFSPPPGGPRLEGEYLQLSDNRYWNFENSPSPTLPNEYREWEGTRGRSRKFEL